MQIKTEISVLVFYDDETAFRHVFDDVNKAATFQQACLTATNVLQALLNMSMRKDIEHHG